MEPQPRQVVLLQVTYAESLGDIDPDAENEPRNDLTLEPRTTVLVGPNGAGKTWVLRHLHGEGRGGSKGPVLFRLQNGHYRFRMSTPEIDEAGDVRMVRLGTEGFVPPSWDSGNILESLFCDETRLWGRQRAVLWQSSGPLTYVPTSASVFDLDIPNDPTTNAIRGWENGIRVVLHGYPAQRETGFRAAFGRVAMGPNGAIQYFLPPSEQLPRSLALMQRLTNFLLGEADRIEGLQRALERIGYHGGLSLTMTEVTKGEKVGIIKLGDQALYHVSDGSLRVLEILTALYDPESTLVLIEEPETGIHPGLLSKILHEIEAVSITTQVVLTTHSPTVVSHFPARSLRLISNQPTVGSASTVADTDLRRVEHWLADEGTLGDI